VTGDAGTAARAWVAALAQRHGGYTALARAAGLGPSWARFARTGAVPRLQTVGRLAQFDGTNPCDLEAIRQDVSAFWQTRFAHLRKPKARCTVCGRQYSPANAAHWGSYDPINGVFVHRKCTSTVLVTCPDCKQSRMLPRWKVNSLRKAEPRQVDKRPRITETADGQLYVQCRPCALRLVARVGCKGQNERLLLERAARIDQYGPETPGDRRLIETLQAHKLPLKSAAFLVDKARHTKVLDLLRVLRTEQLRRKLGHGNVEFGREVQIQGLRAVHHRDGSADRARLPSERTPRLTGTFALCALCGLLLYRAKTQDSRRSQRHWHGPCWTAWRQLPNVKAWLHERRVDVSHGIPPNLLSDFPTPPPRHGAPVTSDDLFAAYRVLLQNAKGRSRAELAHAEGVSKPAITQRIKAVRDRLPASWKLVFSSKAVVARQRIVSLPLAGPGQRRAAAGMSRLGIPTPVVAAVTGLADVTEAD